jgi:hypothetical protein
MSSVEQHVPVYPWFEEDQIEKEEEGRMLDKGIRKG